MKDFDRFKFPLTEEEQAVLLNEIDILKKELRDRLYPDVVVSQIEAAAWVNSLIKEVLGEEVRK